MATSPHILSFKSRLNDIANSVRPHLPKLTRLLLTSSFFEDGVRSIIGTTPHIYRVLLHRGYLPRHSAISATLVIVTSIFSIFGSLSLVFGIREKLGCFLLLVVLLYQQIIFGSSFKHDAEGSFGLLLRNLCLGGSVVLIVFERWIRESLFVALPRVGGGSRARVRIKAGDGLVFLGRVLLGSLALDIGRSFGWSWLWWIVMGVPVTFMICGLYMDVMGMVLMVGYLISGLWGVQGVKNMTVYQKEMLRVEFIQNLSIMGGLLLLISLGPGMLSLDAKLRRKVS